MRHLRTVLGGLLVAGLAWGATQTQAAPTNRPVARIAVRPIGGLIEKDGKSWQPVEIFLRDPAGTANAVLRVDGAVADRREIEAGRQVTEVLLPAVDAEKKVEVSVEMGGETLIASATMRPVRKLTIYVLPQSHMDLGYTAIQTEVEKQQIEFLRQGIELARKTADYPEGSRFIWNEEVLWGADLYLRRLPEADRAALVDAVKKGWVSLQAMYGNMLISLCRPEELLQVFDEAARLSELTGVKIDCAMHTDCPGVTWGFVTALSQAGVRYFSLAPNFRSRVGTFLPEWHDKPFWWVSPSGKEKVLLWLPARGYSIPTVMPNMDNQWAGEYMKELDDCHYPYDISYIRYGMDNVGPEPKLPEFVRNWNSTYVWPKFVIASTKTAFAEMEKRYGDKLPEIKGDFTSYWEDGAASSARETAMNRNTADRIVQAETLFAMLNPARFPHEAVREAWRNVLLYSEHTWGDNGSVTDAEGKETKEQWAIKQAFALDADKQSKQLLEQALEMRAGTTPLDPPLPRGDEEKEPRGDKSDLPSGDKLNETPSAVDVFNTTSWPRTELVVVSQAFSGAGDRVTDQAGKPVPSQRLSTGELAILAGDVPPFAAVRFKIAAGEPAAPAEPVSADHATIANGVVIARVDEKTGGITELKRHGSEQNYAPAGGGEALNDYVYMIGDKPAGAKGSDVPTITVVEKGPLVATLRVESQAAGCNKLTRDLRLVAGADYVEVINTLDKQRVPHDKRPRKRGGVSYNSPQAKESVNFAFPFNVDAGQIRLNVPWSVMRPEKDQLPGSCKDWLEVGRWADVSNEREGVTLATLDAPLVEVGQLSTLLGGAMDPKPWRQHIEPTQKLFSWVMNNHWYTNYCAYQEGTVVFRYALRPHGSYDAAAAERFGTGLSQPLVVAAARGAAPSGTSLLRVEPVSVLVTALKPSADGKAWIVRLFGASGQDQQAKLTWSSETPPSIWLSDLSERPASKPGEAIPVAGWGLVTLRVERGARGD